MNRDKVFLLHIRDALERIGDYVSIGRDAFMTDHMRQDAVIRQLEIVGEATKRLSDEVLVEAPAIPWRRIASLRDRLIHAYDKVDLQRVWEVVDRDVPTLRQAVIDLLSARRHLEPRTEGD